MVPSKYMKIKVAFTLLYINHISAPLAPYTWFSISGRPERLPTSCLVGEVTKVGINISVQ
jgi:hypothetical protein